MNGKKAKRLHRQSEQTVVGTLLPNFDPNTFKMPVSDISRKFEPSCTMYNIFTRTYQNIK